MLNTPTPSYESILYAGILSHGVHVHLKVAIESLFF